MPSNIENPIWFGKFPNIHVIYPGSLALSDKKQNQMITIIMSGLSCANQACWQFTKSSYQINIDQQRTIGNPGTCFGISLESIKILSTVAVIAVNWTK